MSSGQRARTRENFPKMKVRGKGRHKNLRPKHEAAWVTISATEHPFKRLTEMIIRIQEPTHLARDWIEGLTELLDDVPEDYTLGGR